MHIDNKRNFQCFIAILLWFSERGTLAEDFYLLSLQELTIKVGSIHTVPGNSMSTQER